MSLVRMIAEHHHFGSSLLAGLVWVLQSGPPSLLEALAVGSGGLAADLRCRFRALRRALATALWGSVELLQVHLLSHARAFDDSPRIRYHRLCVLRQ